MKQKTYIQMVNDFEEQRRREEYNLASYIQTGNTTAEERCRGILSGISRSFDILQKRLLEDAEGE